MSISDYQQGYEDGRNKSGGLGCLGIIVSIFLLYFVTVKWGWDIPFLSNLFKYDGKTAEQWFLDYADIQSKYNDIEDDAVTAQNMRECVDKTKSTFREVLSQCKPENDCDINKLLQNGSFEAMNEEIDKSVLTCYKEHFDD